MDELKTFLVKIQTYNSWDELADFTTYLISACNEKEACKIAENLFIDDYGIFIASSDAIEIKATHNGTKIKLVFEN